MSEQIELQTVDGPMPAYLARPIGAPRGAVLVVQEAFGLARHIEDVTDRLAADGWYALAPAFFHRQGVRTVPYDDLPRVMEIMGQLTGDGIEADLAAATDHFRAAGFGPQQCGIVGFCMGGTVTFQAATSGQFGAAVTYYGGGLTTSRFGFAPLIDLAPDLQAAWLGLFGDLDKGIPFADVELLRTATQSASVPTDIVRYAAADHGFLCDERAAVYEPAAAADAWQRTTTWFDTHLAEAAVS
jgi:carboxymethylenebutenolidase